MMRTGTTGAHTHTHTHTHTYNKHRSTHKTQEHTHTFANIMHRSTNPYRERCSRHREEGLETRGLVKCEGGHVQGDL